MDDASVNKTAVASTSTVIALRARREAFQITAAVAMGRPRAGDPVPCVKCGNRFVPPEDAPQRLSCPACTPRPAPTASPLDDSNPPAETLLDASSAARALLAVCEGWFSCQAKLDDVRQAIWAYIRALPAEWYLVREMTQFVVQIDEFDDVEMPDRTKAFYLISRISARILWLHPDADPTSLEERGVRLTQIAEAILSAIAQFQRREISLAGVRTALRGYIDALEGRAPVTQVMENYLLDLKESEFGGTNASARRTSDLLDSLTRELRMLHGVSDEKI